jgi:hypothetical protein
MKKITRKGIIKKLDKVVSEITLKREPKCVMCGSKEQLGNGHLFSRTHYSLRWDVREDGNCHTQCWKHNFAHSQSDHVPYDTWYQWKFGIKRFLELHNEWEQVTKFKTYQLEELYEQYKIFLAGVGCESKV